MKAPLLTTSCTDALEMAALLLNIKTGDEVIVPSYTFVSTANAFALRGAEIKFADSGRYHPNVTAETIEEHITNNTKAIVIVHYSGVSCDIDSIKLLCNGRNIHVIEDAAQAIESTYKGKQLGTLGSFGTFSFHETKNITCGEGGLLSVNDPEFIKRAEIIREKGTNRSAFFRGEIDKYGWVDIGSSFLPSDILAAYLYAQLESISIIQEKRISLWNRYYENLQPYSAELNFSLPLIPEWASNNAHMFYILMENEEARNLILIKARTAKIGMVFHYQSLHSSTFGQRYGASAPLPNSDRFSKCLVRLPLFNSMTLDQVDQVCDFLVSSL